jgi:hypothetical protein
LARTPSVARSLKAPFSASSRTIFLETTPLRIFFLASWSVAGESMQPADKGICPLAEGPKIRAHLLDGTPVHHHPAVGLCYGLTWTVVASSLGCRLFNGAQVDTRSFASRMESCSSLRNTASWRKMER